MGALGRLPMMGLVQVFLVHGGVFRGNGAFSLWGIRPVSSVDRGFLGPERRLGTIASFSYLFSLFLLHDISAYL